MQKIMEAAKKQIDGLLAEKDMVIMAIDGKCTSGKTTLASKLAEIYDCNVFHMGYNAIAYALNDMHIPARKGQWSQTSIVNILTNEVYLGKIHHRYVYQAKCNPLQRNQKAAEIGSRAHAKEGIRLPGKAGGDGDHPYHPAHPGQLRCSDDCRKEPPVETGHEKSNRL